MVRAKGWVIEFAEDDLSEVEGLHEDIVDTLSVVEEGVSFGGNVLQVADSQTALMIKLRFGDHIEKVERLKTS